MICVAHTNTHAGNSLFSTHTQQESEKAREGIESEREG